MEPTPQSGPDKLRIIRFVPGGQPGARSLAPIDYPKERVPATPPVVIPEPRPAPVPVPPDPRLLSAPATLSFAQVMFSFNGRLGRGQYFWAFILTWIVLTAVPVAVAAVGGVSLVGLVEQLISTGLDFQSVLVHYSIVAALIILLWIIGSWMSWATQVKRWHDLGRSGWWVLLTPILAAIPYVGWLISVIILVYLFLVRGTVGANTYGADPCSPTTAEYIAQVPHAASLPSSGPSPRRVSADLEDPKRRLAMGEITLEEYQRIRAALGEE